MRYYINEKETSFQEAVDCIFKVYTKEKDQERFFLDYLNDYEGVIELFEGVEYGVGTILKSVDPKMFKKLLKERLEKNAYKSVSNVLPNVTHVYYGNGYWTIPSMNKKKIHRRPKVTFRREE